MAAKYVELYDRRVAQAFRQRLGRYVERRPSPLATLSMAEIYIYPAFNAKYYSLYILGLRWLFGPKSLRYTATGFPRFGTDCLALRTAEPERRIYIHSNDMPELDPQGLAWCDVFGKVNLDPGMVPEWHRSKVLALGPTFAVQVWAALAAEARGLANFLLSREACGSLRQHLANYRGQYSSRFSEGAYTPSVSHGDYIFFNAALWEREPEANALRARFVEACRSQDGIRFEGGLTPRKSARGSRHFRAAGFEPYICRRYSAREYLEKSRLSAVVLNNPAYRDCHSWRLAEYLALGKAVISTPIVRALPAPLLHGTHVHYVEGSVESFQDAILRICSDTEYRRMLETNARAYYEAHLSPTSVVRRMLQQVGTVAGQGLMAQAIR